VTSGGAVRYVANGFGVYRLDPDPLRVSPDAIDIVDLFPDGTLLAVTATDAGAAGVVRVFRLDPAAAAQGGLSLADLSPWAVATVPHNRGACAGACAPAVVVTDAAAAPDGAVFVSVRTAGDADVLPEHLSARGVLRFAPDATGVSAGFVTLDAVERLRF
jgi:hypothetical protein